MTEKTKMKTISREINRRRKISKTLIQKYASGQRKSWNIGLKGIKTNKLGGQAWNKNKKLHYNVWNKELTKKTDDRLKRLSEKHKGIRFTPYTEFQKGHIGWGYIDGRSKFLPPARYGDDWDKIRYLVYLRDKFTCQMCGIKKERLDVHHKIPFLISFDNSLGNLVALCKSCHRKEDVRLFKINSKIKIENQKMIEENKITLADCDKQKNKREV